MVKNAEKEEDADTCGENDEKGKKNENRRDAFLTKMGRKRILSKFGSGCGLLYGSMPKCQKVPYCNL